MPEFPKCILESLQSLLSSCRLFSFLFYFITKCASDSDFTGSRLTFFDKYSFRHYILFPTNIYCVILLVVLHF